MRGLTNKMMIRLTIVTILCCWAVMAGATSHKAAAPQPAPNAPDQRIAAVVNDVAITRDDLESRIRLAQVAANLPNTPQTHDELKPQVLKALIDEQLELQEAAHQDIKVEEADIDAAFGRVAEQNKMSPEQFTAALQAQGVSMAAMRFEIKAQIAWIRVVQKIIRPRINITPEEVDEALNRIKANAGKPQYLTAEIFLGVDTPEQDAGVKANADKLVEELRHGGNFALAARQFSQSAGAASGGDLGWVQQGQLSPALEEPLSKLRVGEISDPIKDDSGYHILLLRDRGTVAGPDAATTKLHLLQMVLPAKSTEPDALQKTQDKANELIADTSGCDVAKVKAQAMNDGVSGDLGDVTLAQLPPQILNAVQTLDVGKFTPPLRTPKGYLLLMVCERKEPQSNLPNRDDMANTIGYERMDMQQRRYLRDLRASAYVDIRS